MCTHTLADNERVSMIYWLRRSICCHVYSGSSVSLALTTSRCRLSAFAKYVRKEITLLSSASLRVYVLLVNLYPNCVYPRPRELCAASHCQILSADSANVALHIQPLHLNLKNAFNLQSRAGLMPPAFRRPTPQQNGTLSTASMGYRTRSSMTSCSRKNSILRRCV